MNGTLLESTRAMIAHAGLTLIGQKQLSMQPIFGIDPQQQPSKMTLHLTRSGTKKNQALLI